MTAGNLGRPGAGRGSGSGLFLALAVPLAAGVALLVPGAAESLELERGAVAREPWRIIGGHLAHYTLAHWALDALAFLVLAASCVRLHPRRTWLALAAAGFAVPIAVLLFAPEIQRYRGLSGLDSALFGLFAALQLRERRAPVPLLAAAAFLAKLAFEQYSGRSLFLTSDAFVAVPIAHLAGALCGIVVGLAPAPGRRIGLRALLGSAAAWWTSPARRRVPHRPASSASSR